MSQLRKLFNLRAVRTACKIHIRVGTGFCAQFYGTQILLSESTYEKAADQFLFPKIDRVQIKGRRQPLTVFELLGPCSSESDVTWAAFEGGTEVQLPADPKPGWNFAFWFDGKKMYSDISAALTVSADKALMAAFRPLGSVIPLRAADFDRAPLGARTPLILVHGNNNEKDGKYGAWDSYAANIKNIGSLGKNTRHIFSAGIQIRPI